MTLTKSDQTGLEKNISYQYFQELKKNPAVGNLRGNWIGIVDGKLEKIARTQKELYESISNHHSDKSHYFLFYIPHVHENSADVYPVSLIMHRNK